MKKNNAYQLFPNFFHKMEEHKTNIIQFRASFPKYMVQLKPIFELFQFFFKSVMTSGEENEPHAHDILSFDYCKPIRL